MVEGVAAPPESSNMRGSAPKSGSPRHLVGSTPQRQQSTTTDSLTSDGWSPTSWPDPFAFVAGCDAGVEAARLRPDLGRHLGVGEAPSSTPDRSCPESDRDLADEP